MSSRGIWDGVMMYGAPSSPGPIIPDVSPPEPFDWSKIVLPVAAPPPYAQDDEAAAIAAIVKLDERARARVLRYLTSRYGEHKP